MDGTRHGVGRVGTEEHDSSCTGGICGDREVGGSWDFRRRMYRCRPCSCGSGGSSGSDNSGGGGGGGNIGVLVSWLHGPFVSQGGGIRSYMRAKRRACIR